MVVSVEVNGKRITKTIHKMICTTFHGQPPTPKHQVRHLNGNKQDNRPDNLTWGTQEENWVDRRMHNAARDGNQ
jgi:hypothetical protein